MAIRVLIDAFASRQPKKPSDGHSTSAALTARVDRGEILPGTDRTEVIDALVGAYWARAWATDGFTRDGSVRLVRSVFGLVGAAGEREPQSAKTSRLSWTKNV